MILLKHKQQQCFKNKIAEKEFGFRKVILSFSANIYNKYMKILR